MELKALTGLPEAVKNIGYNNYVQRLSWSDNSLFFVKMKHDLTHNYLS